MEENKTAKILWNNIRFFQRNLAILIKLRPKIKVVFSPQQKNSVGLHLEGELCHNDGVTDYIENHYRLHAFNTSIILNCFSLFEASFERLLLENLNTKNLSGIQEKVMLKYIENVLKLSSHSNYAKEYKFITGKNIKDLFTPEEKYFYQVIDKFYTLRHILIHGSSSKNIIVAQKHGGAVELDTDDLEYQELVEFIKEKFGIQVPSNRFSLDILLMLNEVTDLLAMATLNISHKLFDNSKFKLQYIKADIFEDM